MMKGKLWLILAIAILLVTVLAPVTSVYAGDGDYNDANEPQIGGEYTNEGLNYGDESINGLFWKLVNDGGWCSWSGGSFVYGGSAAWEEDFKYSGFGGTDYLYMDDVDLGMFQGHSTIINGHRALQFIDANHDDRYLEWWEAEWGDHDLEWMFIHACSVLDDANRGYWSSAFFGSHLICGAKTSMYDNDDGTVIAGYLIDDGWWDWARTVKSSWFQGCDTHQPYGVVLCVIGETSECGNDYVWGQGSVCSDPSHDLYYNYWTHTCY